MMPTAGPYRHRAGVVYGADGKPIADCWTPKRGPAEREANGRLLAASWSLLDAALKALALLDLLPSQVAISLEHLERCGEVGEELAAAVALATGREEAA